MRHLAAITVLVVYSVLAAAGVAAQRPGQGRRGVPPPHVVPAGSYNGAFRFCRISFRSLPEGDGDGWYVDYPRADVNLTTRLAELTNTPITHDLEDNPIHVVVRLTDTELFECPFVMMTEPGGSYFDDREARALRTYFLKGGFLWADDFWGSAAWDWWAGQIGKVLPPGEYPIVDVPRDHPIFHTMFDIASVPQIPNIGLWLRRRLTSERGADSAEPHARAIMDHEGRMIVFMTHNTDFGDSYEEERVSPDYFRRFSVEGYAVGINVLLYAMAH
jgi:Domain of unknown function (DUF4159)